MSIDRRQLLVSAGAVAVAAAPISAMAGTPIEVHKSPACGCCGAWVAHLQENGFSPIVNDHNDLTPIKDIAGVPRRLRSCHTALIGGYVIEGHVPAHDIRRLLAARPKAAGLAVPDMPVGSPGMEMGARRDPYDVILFDHAGGTEVFASY